MAVKVYDRPLSHSSISMYLECPQKFKFRYIDKIPEAPKWFFSFGQSVHKALEFFYAVAVPPPPPLPAVLAHYKEHWKREGYKNAQQEREYFADGEKILADYYDLHIPTFRPPLFTEYKFELNVDGVPVMGFVDRVDKLDNGKLAVVDYKTGKAIKADRVEEDPQLTMYQMAVEELLGAKVENLTFYHLPSQTPLTVKPRPKALVKELRERVVDVNERIQSERFDPTPDEKKCQWCDYKPHCPVFRHMYAAPPPMPELFPEPAAAAPAAGDHQKLSALVDRAGELLEKTRALEEEAAAVRGEILDLLRKNGFVRAFGNRFEVSLQSESRWDVADRTKLLEVLRRHDLYDRVLKPSAPEVYRLLDDPAVPAAARRELEAVASKKDSPALAVKPLR